MKTEYILTDEQKKQIHELHKQIFKLQLEISYIYAMADVRYIAETEIENKNMMKYFGIEPNQMQGIVKINSISESY